MRKGGVIQMAILESRRRVIVASLVTLTIPLIILYAPILRLMTRIVDRDIGGRNRPFILSFLWTINSLMIVVAEIGFLWGMSMLFRRRTCLKREYSTFSIFIAVVVLGHTALFFAAWLQHSLSLIAD